MSLPANAEFGPIRSLLWPIRQGELKKLVPMFLMLFFICFNYSLLRNMKDALVVTAQSSGAEVIPFIKVWVLLPMAVILTIAFTKLSNRFSQERVFYFMILGFLVFYGLFAFVLYPMRDVIHPHATADMLEKILPAGAKGFVAMCRNWSFTCFYVLSELWGTMIMSVLFWGFVNEVTKLNEAHRFYSVLGVGANLAAIAAGLFGSYFSRNAYNPSLPFGYDAWGQSLICLVSMIIISGLGVMAIFRWMNKKVLTDPCFDEFHNTKKAFKKEKQRLSFRESFTYLSQSKYLLCIAVIVVSYNLVINLVEVVWKDQLRMLYPTPADYNTYMSNLTFMIGVLSTTTAIFMARIIERLGWTRTALITPVIMLVTCGGFFTFFLFRERLADMVMLLTGTTPLVIAVFFGGAQNCLSKAAKYSVFDTTKEMAFIPLSHECKLKGKAAIDGVGSRFGKSGGSLIHTGLLMVFATVSASAPYVAVILLIVIGLWMTAARLLGRQFVAITTTASPDAQATVELPSSPNAQVASPDFATQNIALSKP